MESLLNALRVTIRTHKGIEDGQDVATVIHHARKNIAKLRVAFCLAVPFGQDDCGHFDVLPQLVRGMAAQEQAIEKGGLTLREVEIVHDFPQREAATLLDSGRANASTALTDPARQPASS